MTRLLRSLLAVGLVAGSLAVGAPASAAPGDPVSQTGREPVMLVVDTSGSMGDDDGTGVAKIDGARRALLDLLNVLPVDSELGLRTYPAAGSGCDSGRLAFPPGPRTPASMAADVNALRAGGDTPTAEALEAAGADLRAAGYDSATLVLVSDGLSTCGDPCPVAQALHASGLDVTVNTVGFRIEADGADELRCIATATGGTYTDVTDSESLGRTLAELNGAELGVNLEYPENYSPAADGPLNVEVSIRNRSSVEALDVRASIVFDPAASGGSPTVLRPVRVLGNLAGGATTSATWQIYPSTVRSDGTLDFGVTVTRSGGPPEVATGTIELGGTLNIAAAGKPFQDVQHVVVLGDSYSSGEGAGVRAPEGHRYKEGDCHRSDYTYAGQLFARSGARVTNIACSGAVIGDHEKKQSHRDVAPQQYQLKGAGDADLVFLTMGGNDLNFSAIIKNCLLGGDCTANPVTCALEIRGDALAGDFPFCDKAAVSAPVLWQWQLGNLRPSLVTYYEKVLTQTGGIDGGGPPLVVLPYPNALPTGAWAMGCQRGFPGLSDREISLIHWLQDSLNNQIVQAVADVRTRQPRAEIYFADDVVHAVEPDNTLCGSDRWINGILDGEFTNEKIHPNAFGYRAEAAALLRWSRTITDPAPREIRDSRPLRYQIGGAIVDVGGDFLQGVVNGAQDLWHDVQDIDLRVPTLTPVYPGLPYRVFGSGFAPGETAVVSVASTPQALATAVADEKGVIDAVVHLPDDLPAGEHTLFATGFTSDGGMQVVGRAIEVTGPPLAGPLTVGAGALLLLLGGGLLLRYGLRRRRTGVALGSAGTAPAPEAGP